MISIDGSMGEGGGQIVRNAVVLAGLTGREIEVHDVRGRRSPPGLRPQHVACVRAASDVCGARLSGDSEGSTYLQFEPDDIHPGNFDWDIGTAGSLTLLLQTVLPLLSRADEASECRVTGGTHVRSSPTYDYFERVYLPHVKEIGFRCSAHLLRYGFYPKGGGRVRMTVSPSASGNRDVDWTGDRSYKEIRALSVATKDLKDRRVAERQIDGVTSVFGNGVSDSTHYVDSSSTGTAVLVHADGPPPFPGAVALGKKGKPAEEVGEAAADPVHRCLRSGLPLDRRLPDQLLLPIALQANRFRLPLPERTSHFSTQLDLLERFNVAPETDTRFRSGSEERIILDFSGVSL